VTPAELAALLRALNLKQTEAARRLGIDHSTLWRQLHGHTPVSGPVAAAVRGWYAQQRKEVAT
jgi:predicted DNA-binding protein (UPF0251 family)